MPRRTFPKQAEAGINWAWTTLTAVFVGRDATAARATAHSQTNALLAKHP